ncbi:hypothetical protein AV530_000001 [Patagioenas fasciata monilis]|uniref:Reverse transcriptase/retrotransposon-derived protein RNase H-like domain-containing protein n=1 Tax=Patagioenas fasciata monilis TaxID=372326 RepID=A0A1V4J961_PATFA|nr:hypothetical protein AV530_000001 [Patagioenas fasciata monilis]
MEKPFELFTHKRQAVALFTLRQKITAFAPHVLTTVLEQKGGHWLSPSRMLKYQAVLLEQDDVALKTTNLVNPAVFLSAKVEEENLTHDCLQTIDEVFSSYPHLRDMLLLKPDCELYTDGSSFVQNGKRMSGYTVTTVTQIIESKALPNCTSAQKVELVTLT